MLQPCRIVVLISGQGTILNAILSAIKNRPIPAQICAVFSNNADAFGLAYAEKEGIPARIIEPQNYSDRADYDAALIHEIDAFHPDLIVLAGFMRVLTPLFTRHYIGRLINIHPALLPAYPGRYTHERVLAAGEKTHGSTVHFVNDVLDGGPIIAQTSVPVLANDTVETLSQRVKLAEAELYPTVIDWFATQRLVLKENVVYLDGKKLPVQGIMHALNS